MGLYKLGLFCDTVISPVDCNFSIKKLIKWVDEDDKEKRLLALSHKQKLKKSKHMQAQQTIMNWGGGVTQEAQILPIAYPSKDN